MARYTGPVCRLCRRERTKLYLKGERCFTMKCPVAENSDRQMRAFRRACTVVTVKPGFRST